MKARMLEKVLIVDGKDDIRMIAEVVPRSMGALRYAADIHPEPGAIR